MKTASTARVRIAAHVVLLGLLLVLALRMTMTETVRQTLAQKAGSIAAEASGKGDVLPPFDGPAATVGCAVIVAALAGAAAACAALAGALTASRRARFVLVVAIITLGFVAALKAENRFDGLVGACDLGLALLAGWSVAILCHPRLLGDSGRRILLAALVAIFAAWTFKGLYQRFAEFPDTIADFQKDKVHLLEQNGIRPTDEYQVTAFESRLKSMEVFGFISISNVMATGLIGLAAALAGLLAGYGIDRRKPRTLSSIPEPHAPPKSKDALKYAPAPPPKQEVSLVAVLVIALSALLALGMVTAIFTGSRGGAFFCIGGPIVIVLGALIWKKIVAWRHKMLLGAAIAAAFVVAIALAYGLRHDSLPSKSLMFRWHYWTASAKLIERWPLIGVGPDNFGSYYGSVKRPSSPEDVSDPHSFFIRIAAEMGIPAALLMAAWIGWQVLAACRRSVEQDRNPAPVLDPMPAFAAALLFCAAWWSLHYALADAPNAYNGIMACLFAIGSAAFGWMAMWLSNQLSGIAVRAAAIAALVGALGMFAYDQINMALVTGPVAMLFWILLGLADSYPPRPAAHLAAIPASRPQHWFAWIPAIAAVVAAAVLAFSVWLPLLNDNMPWNPAPFEYQFLKASAPPIDRAAALAAINAAIARAPRSIELINQRIHTRLAMDLPVAEDIDRILQLDRANARPRITLAELPSDLPPTRRIAMLQEALLLDAQLPLDEIKRLSPAEIVQIQKFIEQLSSASPASRPLRLSPE